MIRTAIVSTALAVGIHAFSGVAPGSAAAAQAAQVTAADAAPFVGAWTLELQGPNGPGTFDLIVKVEKEKVVGEVSTAAAATQAITDVTKAEKSLVLRYSFDYQGNPVDAVIRLTPAAEGKATAQIDFAGGAYIMTGTATKKAK